MSWCGVTRLGLRRTGHSLDTFVVSLCAGQEKSRIPPKPTSEKTTFMLDFFPNSLIRRQFQRFRWSASTRGLSPWRASAWLEMESNEQTAAA